MFLMLDNFSRAYFVGVLCTVTWGYFTFLKLQIRIRRESRHDNGLKPDVFSHLERQLHKLCSIESFAMVLTSGCCANQIFGVWFTYMARVTDANPFFALREAWILSQILICLIVSLDALRRLSAAALERSCTL
jgi:hypothetical protein